MDSTEVVIEKIQRLAVHEGAPVPPAGYEELVFILVEVILDGHRKQVTPPDPA